MTVVLTIAVLLFGIITFLQAKEIERLQMVTVHFVNILEEFNRKLKSFDNRFAKVEQVAYNAQNKAIANQKRLERSVVYEKPL